MDKKTAAYKLLFPDPPRDEQWFWIKFEGDVFGPFCSSAMYKWYEHRPIHVPLVLMQIAVKEPLIFTSLESYIVERRREKKLLFSVVSPQNRLSDTVAQQVDQLNRISKRMDTLVAERGIVYSRERLDTWTPSTASYRTARLRYGYLGPIIQNTLPTATEPSFSVYEEHQLDRFSPLRSYSIRSLPPAYDGEHLRAPSDTFSAPPSYEQSQLEAGRNLVS